jgi:hypothetical protein
MRKPNRPAGRSLNGKDTVLDMCVDLIKRFGWAVQCVIPAHGTPGWSYSVGLTPGGLPELLIRDMQFTAAGGYINYAAKNLTGRVWEIPGPGDVTTVVMRDGSWWTVRPHPVRPGPGAEYSVAVARTLYGGRYRLAVLELVPPASLYTKPGTPWPGASCVVPGCKTKH